MPARVGLIIIPHQGFEVKVCRPCRTAQERFQVHGSTSISMFRPRTESDTTVLSRTSTAPSWHAFPPRRDVSPHSLSLFIYCTMRSRIGARKMIHPQEESSPLTHSLFGEKSFLSGTVLRTRLRRAQKSGGFSVQNRRFAL